MKDIKGYEHLYAITSCGKVWSYRLKRFLKQSLVGPYLVVNLRDNNGNRKQFKVHRLVAQTYIPNPNNLPLVNHKNEIKTNNYINNLEWCNEKYNSNYGTRNEKNSVSNRGNKKQSMSVKCIETGIIYASMREAERNTGISNASISACCLGKRETAGGYHWEKVDVNQVNNKIIRKIICLETNKIYNSATQAERELNIFATNILKVCRGERQTAGGYHWCFYKEDNNE